MPQAPPVNQRIKIAFISIALIMFAISLRLFYWQVIKAQTLRSAAVRQTVTENVIRGQRGRIYTADGKLLVGNQTVYDLYVNKREIKLDQLEIINQLTQLVTDYYYQQQPEEEQAELATASTEPSNSKFETELLQNQLSEAFSRSSSWQLLVPAIPIELKTEIEKAKIAGLHLIEQSVRHYPEGTMAAHITGFVGKDDHLQDIGYFGIEGALDKELKGDERTIKFKKDGQGQQLADQKLDFSNLDGRDITLTIRRDFQYIASEELLKGVKNSGSKSGEVIIMDPKTGAILALATWPHYDPTLYHQTPTDSFKNPCLTNLYEPGSTFKIFTMATGLDLGVISPDTTCDRCSGPRTFGNYTIKTWNEEYNPNIEMTEALRKSDNTALVFVVEKIGEEKFLEYLKKFGIGEALAIDLQEDRATPIKDRLRPVELANASFGQGFLTNSMQLIRAAGAIANQGQMMKPYIIEQVTDAQTKETITYHPQSMRQVISTEAAEQLIKMMIHAAPNRNSWITQHYLVAGKTGTAQIAQETGGGYREQGTIASFIGFAPADEPKFVMIVRLNEPTISPWAEATAVPIWYNIANKIMLLL